MMKILQFNKRKTTSQNPAEEERMDRILAVQRLLNENSRKYRKFNGLIFFRPNKSVGLAFIGCGLATALSANALPYDPLFTPGLLISGFVGIVYGGFHIDKSRIDR